MIFIVSGDGPRCGSVMMLRALDSGGLPVIHQPECDEAAHAQATEDYHPSPEGLIELSLEYQQLTLGFPEPLLFRDKVFKCFPPPWGELLRICAGNYRICWLHRPRRERYDSFYRFHSRIPLEWDMSRAAEAEYARDTRAYESLQIMKQRRDVKIVELEYHDILANPLECMTFLSDAGWPIDPHKAAGIVDPGRCRYRTSKAVSHTLVGLSD